jgi:hypothetical protein
MLCFFQRLPQVQAYFFCTVVIVLLNMTIIGERVKRQIDPSKRRYRVLTVPDPLAANCLWVI